MTLWQDFQERLFPWHAPQWLAVLRTQPTNERGWDRYWRAYRAIYGWDTAPFMAHRPEWAHYEGYEIAQYEREREIREGTHRWLSHGSNA